MARHRTHSIEFKRQVVQEFLAGESPHALAKRHSISRNLIKIWVAKYEAGGLDSDTAATRRSDTKVLLNLKRNTPGRSPFERP